jgi:hypothetical protein
MHLKSTSLGIIFSCVGLLLTGCQAPITASELGGHWVAVSATERDKPLSINPEEIHFRFDPKQMAYNYQSTLNYREAGSFFLEGNILHTLDTLNLASTEKIVSISLLTSDSLRIFMVDNGNPRTLTLVKR